MSKRHYYVLKGSYWSYPCVKSEWFFHEAKGLIIKSYTDEEFKKIQENNPNDVWERIEEAAGE